MSNKIPLTEAAKRLGVSRDYLARLCRQGRVAGAEMRDTGNPRGPVWFVPWPPTIAPGKRGPKGIASNSSR